MKEYCPICDLRGEVIVERRPLKMGRRSVEVEQEFYRCAECGEDWFSPEQMDAVQHQAASRVRQVEDLLDPESIRAVRERLELSQADFEKLLAFGPKTVGRWERGTVFQNRSSDLLIRLVQEIPEVVRFLARRHDVELPADGKWESAGRKEVSEPGVTESQAFRSTTTVPDDLNDLFRPTPGGFAPVIVHLTAEEVSTVS